MTAPAPTKTPANAEPTNKTTPPVPNQPPATNRPNAFGQHIPPTGTGQTGSLTPAPPSPTALRTTALQNAVSVMRSRIPGAKTEDIVAMAEAFYQFLKKDAGQKLGPTGL